MADDFRRLMISARLLGFQYAGRTGRGHHQFVHSKGKITCSSTPSDPHCWHNALRDMEKLAGMKIDRSGRKPRLI